jgi:hypothetical protein
VKKIAKGAAEYCIELRSIDWKTKTIDIEKNAFYACPFLKLPAKLYQTEEELDDEYAGYLPYDPIAIASVLKHQKKGLIWVVGAFRKIGEDKIFELLDAIRKDPSNVRAMERLSPYASLAAKKGYASVAAMLLDYKNEHFTAFDPTKEFTLDQL